MANINPITIWINGQNKVATQLNLLSINDNLINTCLFQYFLLDSEGIQLVTGNITMIEPDYNEYSTSPDSNNYAYQWAAAELSLTIIS
jgi:hypothetical protein